MKNKKNKSKNKSKNLARKHDQFFLSQVEHISVATSILQGYLPEELSKAIDWNTLEYISESSITLELNKRLSDRVFSVKLADGNTAYLPIITILEHQTTNDKWMAVRILEYTALFYTKYIKQKDKPEALPLVYPVVVFHTKGGFKGATDIRDLIAAPRDLIERLALRGFMAVDGCQLSDEALLQHMPGGALLGFMKYVILNNPMIAIQFYAQVAEEYSKSTSVDADVKIMEYILSTGHFESIAEFAKIVDDAGSKQLKEAGMLALDRYKQEHYTKGKAEGKAEVALKMLEIGIDSEIVIETTGLKPDEVKDILKNIQRTSNS